MKFNNKNAPVFFQIVLLSAVMGSLAWGIFELILHRIGIDIDLTLDKIGLDLAVISFHLNLNPGSLIGTACGIFLFFRL